MGSELGMGHEEGSMMGHDFEGRVDRGDCFVLPVYVGEAERPPLYGLSREGGRTDRDRAHSPGHS